MEIFNTSLDFEFEGSRMNPQIIASAQRISVSGVQEKFPAVVDGGRVVLHAERTGCLYH